jgi:hypothetical protein
MQGDILPLLGGAKMSPLLFSQGISEILLCCVPTSVSSSLEKEGMDTKKGEKRGYSLSVFSSCVSMG